MFLDLAKAAVLGVVEGVTEFLPISSTGHLIIINQVISFDPEFTKLFDIIIQLGAILAVVAYFWKRLWPFGNDKENNKTVLLIWTRVIVAVIPAIAFGALFAAKIEEKLFNPLVVALMLVLGGIALVGIEKGTGPLSQNKQGLSPFSSIKDMGYGIALGIGLIQCLAMIPGTSRSAATIVGAMILGATRLVAAEFSFFLAIPTMFAASTYSLLKFDNQISSREAAVLALGFSVSFFVALAVIKYFMNMIQTRTFRGFGYYRIVLGAVIIVLAILRII